MKASAFHEKLRRRYRSRAILRRDLASLFWAAVGVALFVLSYNLVHTPDGPQHWSADWITSLLSERHQSQDKRVALVYITSATLQSLPYTEPVDRGILAKVVTTADQAGAKAIGLDFVFDRVSDPAKDAALREAIAQAQVPVVIGVLDGRSPLGSANLSWQDDFLRSAGYPSSRLSAGHLYFDERRNSYIISDHVIRAIAPNKDGATYRLSFAEALAKAGRWPEALKSPQISWLLPPYDGTETFLTVSAQDIIDRGLLAQPDTLKTLLGDRYVIIGGNFDDRDQHFTPLSVRDDARYPGAWIHAQVLTQILDRRATYAPGWAAEVAIATVVAGFGFWIGRKEIANRDHRVAEVAAALALMLVTVLSFLVHFLFPFTLVFFWGMIGLAAGHYGRWKYT